jgi:3-oxoadipate enol-lactonase
MSFAHVNDIDLHYALDGVPGAPVVVLSHGLGLALGMWDAQLPALAAHARVLRYDTRGHGASAVPAGASSIDDLGRDVLALLDHLRIDRVHFCGLSLGGMTGMWLAIHAPRRIASLVLANTAPQIGTPQMWNARIAAVGTQGMKAISEAAIARWFTPRFIAGSPAVAADLKAMFERTPAAGYTSCCAANRDADLRSSIARIRGATTLVVSGTHDVATPPAHGQWMAKQIFGAGYVELSTAHLSNVEMPKVFTGLVCDHVARVAAAEARAAA